MKTIKVIAIGTKIKMWNGEEGIVTCISINHSLVPSYQVSYFNGEFKDVWVSDLEFKKTKSDEKLSIGFETAVTNNHQKS